MRIKTSLLWLSSLFLILTLTISQAEENKTMRTQKNDDYMPSLITDTPLEGRMLAITMVRKTIGAIQQDGDIKKAVRKEYQDDAALLMRAAELVAIEFKTIAIANNYWRDKQEK
ncbi:hypothetical protein GCM10011365_22730 [Marinicella pacifica]|uniref:Hexameric tyrosine-coordinated heme protein (HTHP) n=1 Tax=Marinicella pacifica TaxID=1171543 RepID=A0A917FS53_9GAMM|nr:hexameric tyrosine-coordinated heme protein [Marinicella pacifica]GGG00911.1 hypothetical protein GCM10011365_22730 [Marinicella pacifica]